MNRKLRSVDAHAVDLILNRAAQAHESGQTQTGYAAHATHSTSDRLAAVEKMLGLLSVMNAGEPAQNLVAQTLARIENHTAAPLSAPSHPMIDASRPLA